MSYSTTATTTYPLAKYSRLYPKSQKSDTEWEHFTNPNIYVVLDVKKSTNIESIRIRIRLSGANQEELVFEDLDMLAISSLSTQNQKTLGPPLKAVYRDAVVGIRYLNPFESTNEPVFRRFQVTFMTSASVLDFINVIGTVCPCKANPITNARPIQPLSGVSQLSQRHGPLTCTSTNIPAHFSSSMMAAPLPFSSSPSLAHQHNQYLTSSLRAEANDSQISSSSPLFQQQRQPGSDATGPTGSSIRHSQPPLVNPRIQGLQQENSLPSSSPPSSSANCVPNNTLPAPLLASDVIPSSDLACAILSSMRESTSLYDLSRDELERLVSNVVQEEGFVKLLENVDSMWRVKSFLGVRSD